MVHLFSPVYHRGRRDFDRINRIDRIEKYQI
jgi:hypothetical protein